jgi:hypothetical protein
LDTKRKILFALGLRVSEKDQVFTLSPPVVSEVGTVEPVPANDGHVAQ